MVSLAVCRPLQPVNDQPSIVSPSAMSVQHVIRRRTMRHWHVVVGCLVVGWLELSIRFVQAADEDVVAWSMCYRDRAISNALDRAEDCLRTKATADGVVLLQWVLNQPFDCFVPVGTGSNSLSGKRKAERLLSGSLAAQYQRQFGADASALLAQSKADTDYVPMQVVVQRYFLTDAGYSAAERLIAVWRDRGEIDLAIALVNRVLQEPVHAARITDSFRRFAQSLGEEATYGRNGLSLGGSSSKEIVGTTTRSEVSKPGIPLGAKYSVAGDLFQFGWMLGGGDGQRNRVVRGSTPLLRASWIADTRSMLRKPEAEQLLKQFEVGQRDLDRPACSASFPILVRDKIVFRSIGELRAIHVATGQTAWSVPCDLPSMTVSGRGGEDATFRYEVERSSNLPSLYATAESWFENSRTGMLSSDGRFVYAITEVAAADEDDELGDGNVQFRSPRSRVRNCLIAVPIDAGESVNPRLTWVHDGYPPATSRSVAGGKIAIGTNRSSSAPAPPNSATGRATFLGVPLPGSTELLCVTEQLGEIHLTALDPSTGATIWSQPVCIPARSNEMDVDRQFRASIPARSNGVVVFPTNTGLLVAFDLARRQLLWVVYVDDLPNVPQVRGRGDYLPPIRGQAGFASSVVMAAGRVVYLPPRSSRIQCLDQATGKTVWTSLRRDGEYVSHIVEGRVLIVGRQSCQALSLADGSEIWSSPTGATVGRGLCFGDRFVLPVEAGRLVTLDMETGRSEGSSMLSSSVPLGHLIAAGNQVYSLSPRSLQAFPQTDHVRAELDSPLAARRTVAERELVLTEIDLTNGRAVSAEQRLLGLYQDELPAAERLRARRHLKQLLLAKLAGSTVPTKEDYERLERLIETPEEQFHFLASRIRHLPRGERDPQAERLVEEVFRLPSGLRYTPPEDGLWSISPAVWNRLARATSVGDVALPHSQGAWFEQALAAQELDAQRRFVRAFDDTAIVTPTRVSLANRLEQNGETQAAETLLLRNRLSGDLVVAADAAVRLSELWERAGFLDDAAEQLESLTTEFAHVNLPNGMTGAEYVAGLVESRHARDVWRRTQAPAWNVDRVAINDTNADEDYVWRPESEGRLTGVSGRSASERTLPFHRQFKLANEQTFELEIQSFPRGNAREENVVVMDRRTMLPRGSIRLAVPNDWPKRQKLAVTGHLIPIGLVHGATGLSALQLGENAPVWQQLPPELQDRSNPTVPGPFGPTFASFLWRNRLFVVDPLDGELLWQRTLTLGSPDRVANEQLEVTGDHLAMVVQSPDRSTYEVYETATGRKLKTVRPGFDLRQSQLAYGRHIVGVVATPEGRRLQILDLLQDAPEVSEPVGERILTHDMGQGEFALLGMDGTLRVFDVPRGRVQVSLKLDESELARFGSFRVVTDRDRYYVSIWRQVPSVTTAHYNHTVNDTPFSGGHLRDDIYAFDRATGRLLWKRATAARTTIPFPRCRVPFLVTYSVVKNRTNANQQSLTIEVLSGTTGETIGYRENIRYDRLLNADYDPLAGTITLSGHASKIELHFGRSLQQHDDYSPR